MRLTKLLDRISSTVEYMYRSLKMTDQNSCSNSISTVAMPLYEGDPPFGTHYSVGGSLYVVRKGSVRKYPSTCISYADIVFYLKNDNF